MGYAQCGYVASVVEGEASATDLFEHALSYSRTREPILQDRRGWWSPVAGHTPSRAGALAPVTDPPLTRVQLAFRGLIQPTEGIETPVVTTVAGAVGLRNWSLGRWSRQASPPACPTPPPSRGRTVPPPRGPTSPAWSRVPRAERAVRTVAPRIPQGRGRVSCRSDPQSRAAWSLRRRVPPWRSPPSCPRRGGRKPFYCRLHRRFSRIRRSSSTRCRRWSG